MSRIPKKLNDELNQDPDYTVCMLTGMRSTCEDPIQRHHNLIYAGSQVQRKFCILAIKKSVHDKANDKLIKAKLDHIMLSRASDAELLEFSHKSEDLFRKRAMLNRTFGEWRAPIKSKIMY